MKGPRLPLKAQYAVTTCAMVVLAIVFLVAGYLIFEAWYGSRARDRLSPAVRAELDALDSRLVFSDRDYERWDQIYEQLSPSATLETGVLVGLGLVVMLLTGAMGFLLASRFGRPVAAVAGAAQSIARGDLAARASTTGAGNVELGELIANFNTMANQLERDEKERRRLIAAIAHELRTPLTIMRGRLQGMMDGLFSTDPQEIQRLATQTDLLARIIEDLRTMSLAQAGRLELRRDAVDLYDLASECIELMRQQLSGSGLHPRLQGDHLIALADRERLMQVIAVFLDNAIRYAPHSGWLDITVSRRGDDALICVADRGSGLPEGGQDLAFDWFWRADESRSRALGGSGLGLAVVRAIASAHGAQTRAYNREGGGSVFELQVPISRHDG